MTAAEPVFAPWSLDARAARIATALRSASPRPRALGLLADNGIDWVSMDLAAQQAGVTLVPLPAFFTPAQLLHAVQESALDGAILPDPVLAARLGFQPAGDLEGLPWYRRDAGGRAPAAAAAKITFTSGTTGEPKGVALSAAAQWAVARSVATALAELKLHCHLCVLPLAVLLENVAGVYAARMAGARCCVPPLAAVGMHGAAAFDARLCLAALADWEAESIILLPQMLAELVAAIEGGAALSHRLRFAAVGGARVSRELLLRARRAGIPVYEGYGLSECASVVSLNRPGADRVGSAGRPLPHAGVRTVDGEIFVRTPEGEWLATGDLGRLDDEGFLHVEGRRSNVFITSFGRNVSPEWPESELLAERAIAQAAVFGEARAQSRAVLVAARGDLPEAAIDAAVRAANARLPDYARVGRWLRADAPFTAVNGLATANGRPRRGAIWRTYGDRLDGLP